MRPALIPAFLALAMLPACSKEPSFDERYAAETNRIEGMAANMQAELDEQLNASVAAGRLALPVNESAANESDAAYNAAALP